MSIDNFTGKAEAYAIGRPGYPKEVIDYISSLVPKEAVFADIGAGTGLFTLNMAERGYTIYAVEPNADMRGQLVITLAPYSNAKVIDGTDIASTLPDHSMDVITIAHALHWFNLDAFRLECNRILKPGGLIIAIYNLTTASDEMSNICKQTVQKFFKEPRIMEFPNIMKYNRERWLAYIASQDGYPMPKEPGYVEHMASVHENFDRNSVDGLLRIERITKVFSS